MEHMGQRIAKALDEKNGGNQSELARFVGVSPQAVQKWIAGKTEPKGEHLKKTAEFLGMTPASLKFGGGSLEAGANNVAMHHRGDPIPPGFVGIKQSRIYFSAGSGHEPEYELIEDSRPVIYALEWFQEHHINPARVRRFKVSGDSQEPMLYDGDSVLVHLEETNIVDGKLYAIRYGNDLRLKFLSRRLDGTLILRSLNKEKYPDEEVHADLANEHISIVGRIRDASGKGGL